MRVLRTLVPALAAAALALPLAASGAAHADGSFVTSGTARADGSAGAGTAGTEMFGNTTFDNGRPDPWGGNDIDVRVENGELVARVPTGRADGEPGGVPSWDRSIRHDGLAFTAGQQYKLSFDARTSRDVAAIASVYTFQGQYIPEWDNAIVLTPETRRVELTITLHRSVSDVSVGLQLGTSGPAYDIALDNFSLTPVTEG
ncbi:carbohydrate binding domain-containing protein [Streptomyces pactum]|uniref:carbohydrate binding domain-containing protein n=1 Tax=Streptomyces pactum TaxID=68249 RepID=UPI003702E283